MVGRNSHKKAVSASAMSHSQFRQRGGGGGAGEFGRSPGGGGVTCLVTDPSLLGNRFGAPVRRAYAGGTGASYRQSASSARVVGAARHAVRASTTSTVAVHTSIRAPNTSPVMPPSRRRACRRSSSAAP